MLNALRPFIAALLTLPIRALAGWLTARGIEGITEDKISDAVEAFIVWGWPLLSVLGIVLRRLIDKAKWANPGNAASSHLAVVEKEQVAAIKADARVADRLEHAGISDAGALNQFRPPEL